jgi:L-ribulose-5-phosphate 3-epimerase
MQRFAGEAPHIFSVDARLRKEPARRFFVEPGHADFSIRKLGFGRLVPMSSEFLDAAGVAAEKCGGLGGEAACATQAGPAGGVQPPGADRRAGREVQPSSRRAFLSGSLALGSVALGRVALGRVALGRVALGRVALGRAVAGAAAGGAAALASSSAAAAADPKPEAAAKPRAFKISLSQWSLHRELLASRLDPLDFAKAANGFGIDAIEYVSQFFQGKARNKAFLAELKQRAAGEGVWSLLIMVEGEGDLGAPTPKARLRAVDSYKKWVEAAAFLGCHSIRVEAGSPKGEGARNEDDAANWVSDGLRRLAEFSDKHGVNVLVENHGGLSSKGSWLSEVLTAVHHPRCGSMPDFGGFDRADGTGYDRYKGVRELMPFARAVGARAYDFDERGEETKINFGQMLEIVTAAGYHGYVGIEYDGERLSERAGIERTKLLLERVRDQLSARSDRRG